MDYYTSNLEKHLNLSFKDSSEVLSLSPASSKTQCVVYKEEILICGVVGGVTTICYSSKLTKILCVQFKYKSISKINDDKVNFILRKIINVVWYYYHIKIKKNINNNFNSYKCKKKKPTIKNKMHKSSQTTKISKNLLNNSLENKHSVEKRLKFFKQLVNIKNIKIIFKKYIIRRNFFKN
ncbi:hypothetical protein RFI_10873 [Reticulomyxa filosa]|uniref:Uncharacterized protein n=1 Tax=Reticulomyxa filosa TaxID=46433 RepID=X6NLK7_RETFI|nr:hypothetical protein RFI_10873 [Reticulomyxa filosa]|eukprot:ETO26267.1 hypothetical protein RFI_10873 [Reticulomyxa filosa]